MASAKRAKVGVVASLELRTFLEKELRQLARGGHGSPFQQPCCVHVWVGSRIVCVQKRMFIQCYPYFCRHMKDRYAGDRDHI